MRWERAPAVVTLLPPPIVRRTVVAKPALPMSTHYEYHGDFVYRFEIARDEMGAVEWAGVDEHPPLPPRRAIALSRQAVLEQFGQYRPENLGFRACALQRTEDAARKYWYYAVTWFVPDAEGEGDPSSFTIPVSFNSVCPKPRISPRTEAEHA